MQVQIKKTSDLIKLWPKLKKDNPSFDIHSMMEMKVEFTQMTERGFMLHYDGGYFFWSKPWPLLNKVSLNE